MSDPADPDLRVTTAEAAKLCGVAPATVRYWRHRGALHSVGKAGRDRLYRLGDVIAAERTVQAAGQGPIRRYRRAPALDDLVESLPA